MMEMSGSGPHMTNGLPPSELAAPQTPNGGADPHTLASMLQERLDAINSEIRMIQEEKHNAERAAEQLEQQWVNEGVPGGGGHYAYDDLNVPARNSPQYEFLMNKYNTVRLTLDEPLT